MSEELKNLKNELYLSNSEFENNYTNKMDDKMDNNINNEENIIINKNFEPEESNKSEELTQNDIKLIKNDNLYNNQYDEKTLSFNMENGTISPYLVLKTQKNLSNEFIVEYILNEKYAVFREDYDITINKVVGLFPNFANFNPRTYYKTNKT